MCFSGFGLQASIWALDDEGTAHFTGDFLASCAEEPISLAGRLAFEGDAGLLVKSVSIYGQLSVDTDLSAVCHGPVLVDSQAQVVVGGEAEFVVNGMNDAGLHTSNMTVNGNVGRHSCSCRTTTKAVHSTVVFDASSSLESCCCVFVLPVCTVGHSRLVDGEGHWRTRFHRCHSWRID